MNVTELARRLKVPTKELRELLPKLGYDIGQKAIKIDQKLANEIIQNWRRLMYEHNKKEEYKRRKAEMERKKEGGEEKKLEASIPSILTVREFAAILDMPINAVIGELMKNGIMASLNERIDYETAAIVAGDLGYKVTVQDVEQEEIEENDSKLQEILSKQEDGQERPPVIVVMGHVDHGKTKLLDTIRKTNVIDTESGGITQHIGAYQVERKDRKITFIDTPGHEAFTAMRSRGAKVADIAILIVAADDSVKQQTVEALRIIQNAELPLVVAINKIDKPEANLDKVKTDLSNYKLIPEEWGGKTVMVPISALQGDGIDELLDMILLTADLQKDELLADPNRPAAGTIIESHVDKGEGIVATVLVQVGTLRRGDMITINGNYYGKVRVMKDHNGQVIDEAPPAKPVKIIGLKVQPKVGDLVEVPEDEKSVSKKAKKYQLEQIKTSSILMKKSEADAEAGKQVLPIVIRADVLGSLEAIIESLDKIESDHIKAQVISRGLGNITENDITMAKASDAVLISFHLNNPPNIEIVARENGVEIKKYDIIYKLIEDIKEIMEERIGEEIVRRDLGKLHVLAIFKTEKKSMIIGGKVLEGEIEFNPNKFKTKIVVTRKGEYVTEGTLEELQAGKLAVKSVEAGQQCGLLFAGRPEIEENDVLEFYTEEKVKRVL